MKTKTTALTILVAGLAGALIGFTRRPKAEPVIVDITDFVAAHVQPEGPYPIAKDCPACDQTTVTIWGSPAPSFCTLCGYGLSMAIPYTPITHPFEPDRCGGLHAV